MMEAPLFIVLTAALACVLGAGVQRAGARLFARRVRDDTRDYAAIVGLRIAAVFSIVVGLIVNSTYGDYADARRSLLEEAGLLRTLHGLAGTFPAALATEARRDIIAYVQRVAGELDPARQDDAALAAASAQLYALCEKSPPDLTGGWTLGEYQRTCSELAELRSRRLARVLEEPQERGPLAAFLFFSLSALALLLGVFTQTRLHLLLGLLFYTASGLTFALIFGLSEPFSGPLALDGAPLLRLIDALAAP
jgi:hypothetical protein